MSNTIIFSLRKGNISVSGQFEADSVFCCDAMALLIWYWYEAVSHRGADHLFVMLSFTICGLIAPRHTYLDVSGWAEVKRGVASRSPVWPQTSVTHRGDRPLPAHSWVSSRQQSRLEAPPSQPHPLQRGSLSLTILLGMEQFVPDFGWWGWP